MKNITVAAALLIGTLSIAQGSVFFTGTLSVADPTWNRPLEGASGLSAVGTSVFYNVQPFFVNTSGTFTFETAAPTPNSYDPFILIYQTAFNAATPLVNHVASDDDFTGAFSVLPGPFAVPGSGTGSGGVTPASQILNVALSAGVQYYAINTTFSNGAGGTFYSGISGLDALGAPIDITLGSIDAQIPEPASVSLAALGIASLIWLSRRSRRVSRR